MKGEAVLAFNIHIYDTLKFVHVLAAIVWVGSGIFVQFEATKLRRANDPLRLAAFAKDIAFWGTRLFMPSSLLVLLMGISLVLYSPGIGVSDAWVWLGLVGYAATFVTGAFFIGPTARKLAEMSQTLPPDDPTLQAAMARIFAISRIDQVVLILVVADMVFKPGG
jgi:uncharacterized membrane protein